MVYAIAVYNMDTEEETFAVKDGEILTATNPDDLQYEVRCINAEWTNMTAQVVKYTKTTETVSA